MKENAIWLSNFWNFKRMISYINYWIKLLVVSNAIDYI